MRRTAEILTIALALAIYVGGCGDDALPGTGNPDLGVDANKVDAEVVDAEVEDAEVVDAEVVDAGPPDSRQCGPGSTLCSDRCVDTSSDNKNCGACGTTCAAGQVCSGGACALSCQSGLTDCSGKCVDLLADINNCGKCATPCAAGQVCSSGKCVLSCQSGLSDCSGKCVDLQSDNKNCGKCGTPCAAGQVCSSGKCVLTCQSGLTDCTGKCVDLKQDIYNCGQCGKACALGQLCCAGGCVDPFTDVKNCGKCGGLCATSQICISGACGANSSCAAILKANSSAKSGTYTIKPGAKAFSAHCDMTTSGGGWTAITLDIARNQLGGTLTAVDSAKTAAMDSAYRPYTRDTSDAHIYYYTFSFAPGFTHFFLNSFSARANAGSGYVSDTCYYGKSSIWSSWTKGNSAHHGDIAFGPTSSPVTGFCKAGQKSVQCQSCTHTWPGGSTIYSMGGKSTAFRIGWGENGTEHEGYYPWYSGTIMIR